MRKIMSSKNDNKNERRRKNKINKFEKQIKEKLIRMMRMMREIWSSESLEQGMPTANNIRTKKLHNIKNKFFT